MYLASFMGYVSALGLGLTLFLISLDHIYRSYSYVALAVYVFLTYFIVLILKDRRSYLLVSRKTFLVFLLLVLACCAQAASTFRSGTEIYGLEIIKIFYSIFSFSAIYLSLKIFGYKWYSEVISIVLVGIGVVANLLRLGGFYLDSLNFYAAFFLIPFMYFLLVGNLKWSLFLLVTIVALGMIFGARGVYMVASIFLLFWVVFKFIKIQPIYVVGVVVALVAFQFYLLQANNVQFDEILSYRPTIWSYYYESTLSNLWFGNGQISEHASQGAASYYQYMISRGVNSSYGPQSMYILYFYETGVIGLVLLGLTMYLVFSTKSNFLIPVLSILTLAFMETVRIGSISVYGLPLTYFVILSLVQYEESHV